MQAMLGSEASLLQCPLPDRDCQARYAASPVYKIGVGIAFLTRADAIANSCWSDFCPSSHRWK